MIVTQDERTAARFEACYPVQIEANGQPIAGRSVNLGIGGLCLEPGFSLPDHTPVVCRVEPEGGPLEAQGEVAWQYAEEGTYRMGIKFCALTPAMAGWLSSVVTSHVTETATRPVSDTQPMKVPLALDDVATAHAATIAPAATQSPASTQPPASTPPPVEQLDLWKKKTAAPPAEPIVLSAADGGEGVETEILFDDMPSPEARMMQTKAAGRGAIAAATTKDRLNAVLTAARGKLVQVSGAIGGPIARFRARRAEVSERTASTQRVAVVERPRTSAAPQTAKSAARTRLVALMATVRSFTARIPNFANQLGSRRLQLIAAVVATLALIISGIAFLFSAGPSVDEDVAAVAALPAAAEDTGSYWDPPVMPVPDQVLAEAAPVPAPEPATELAEAAAPTPREPPAVAIPDMPLPEPPVVGANDEAPLPEPVAVAAELPPDLVEGAAAEPAAAPAPEPRATRERPRTTRRERVRENRAETRRAARSERTARAEDRPIRLEAARAEARTSASRAAREPERTTRTASRASEDRSAHREPRSTAAAAGQTTFRLNLSGAPGAISTYPLANPNGIVIDVANMQHPGDATKLTSDDPRIRFVKIINREQGVRFIVYLTGELPEYKVEPSGRGIRVALDD